MGEGLVSFRAGYSTEATKAVASMPPRLCLGALKLLIKYGVWLVLSETKPTVLAFIYSI